MTERSSESDSGPWDNSPLPSAASKANINGSSNKKPDAGAAYEYFPLGFVPTSDQKESMAQCGVIALGPANVGKTTLLVRLGKRKFEKERNMTIGVDHVEMNILTNHPKYDRESHVVWYDTAGQERFGAFRAASMRHADGAMIVFDSTLPATYETAKRYCADFLEMKPWAQCALVANKIDLYNQGKDADGNPISKWMDAKDWQAEALRIGCAVGFFRCSALDGAEVDNAGIRLIDFTLNKLERINQGLLHDESKSSAGNGTIKLTKSSQINHNNHKNTTIKCCSN